MATVLVDGSLPRSRTRRKGFYVGVSLLIVAIVLAGFAPSFINMAVGPPRPWFMHAHGAIYLGWLALLVCQAVLAARGKIALHRRIGNFGIAYGALIWIVGMIVTFAAPALHVRNGEWDMNQAATFISLPLGDMALFGGLFAAAIVYRAKPEIHKRLILLACVAIMYAGVFRLSYALSMPLQLLAWYSPVIAGMIYDRYKMGRVHRVYWIGAAAMAVSLARIPVGETEAWRSFGRALLTRFI